MMAPCSTEESGVIKDKNLWRDLTSFWILGLCNNFGYVVMLSAAHDIIGRFSEGPMIRSYGEAGTTRQCYEMSTGAILLADIMPSLVTKMLMPFIPFCVKLRVAIAILLSITGFIAVAFAYVEWMALFGVILNSASSGMGEATFMAYSSSFNKNVISTWSSGTGGAGIIGSISYASLIALGFSSRDTLLMMTIFPILEAAVFWLLLRNPKHLTGPLTDFTQEEMDEDAANMTLREKLLYIRQLWKYMLPLSLVYFFEYYINQGLFELLYFQNIFLDKPAQYRWFNVVYQMGVFISRSSVNLVQFPQVWLMSVFQLLNVMYFLTEVIYFYTPSIWITFVIVLWEGLLGGGAYVNTFYRMSREITPNKRRYALSIVVQADSFGIALAGLLAMPIHTTICGIPLLVRSVEW